MDASRTKQTLVDGEVPVLRETVLAGEVRPGEFLPPRRVLARRVGVGVSTVQEAFQALAAVGLVESRPDKGTWVRQDTLETLIHPSAVETRLSYLRSRQVFELRAVIEVALTEMAAQRASADDAQAMAAALDRVSTVIDDDPAFVEGSWSSTPSARRARRPKTTWRSSRTPSERLKTNRQSDRRSDHTSLGHLH